MARAAVWDDVTAGRFGPVPPGRGWFHEAIGIPGKDAVFARARAGDRITASDLADATRVYTPQPVVRFLLQNTLGAMWCGWHPDTPLRRGWGLCLSGAVGGGEPIPARELRVADPCCGSGAFLVAAVEFLADLIQDEEGTIGDPGRRADALVHAAEHAVWGADIDADAVTIAQEALGDVAGRAVVANLTALPSPAGILDPVVWADERFDVVVTNPPYVGTRQMDGSLVAWLRELEGAPVADLAVAVQRRSWGLVARGGRCGTITPAGWLNDRSAASFRRRILDEGGPRLIARLGQGVFDQAPLVFCAVSVLERGAPVDGWDLVDVPSADDDGFATAGEGAVRVTADAVRGTPIPPFAPQVPARILARRDATPFVGDFFTTFDGAWTGSHRRDVHPWWDVPPGEDWVRVSGGQGREGWAAGTVHRMLREHVAGQPDRTGLVEYPRVAGGWLCAREADAGTAARAGIVTFLPRTDDAAVRVDELLAIFNTRVGTAWLRTLTSGLNFNPGYAARVPLGAGPPSGALHEAVREVVALRRLAVRRDPTADAFDRVPWSWDEDDLVDRTRIAVERVDRLTSVHLGIPAGEWDTMDPPRSPRRPWTARDDAWMVAALRSAGVRWPDDPDGASWEITPMPLSDLGEAATELARSGGADGGERDRGHTWIRERLGRYLRMRFGASCPVGVRRGILVPRPEALDG